MHVRERLYGMLFLLAMSGLMLLARFAGYNGDLMMGILALAMLVGSYYFRPRGKDGPSESSKN
jgi:hypothetical protein